MSQVQGTLMSDVTVAMMMMMEMAHWLLVGKSELSDSLLDFLQHSNVEVWTPLLA